MRAGEMSIPSSPRTSALPIFFASSSGRPFSLSVNSDAEACEIAQLSPVEPQEAGEFVDDENFGRQARHQCPFPFGHDGLAGAEDAEGGVLARCEVAKKLPACGWAGVVFYAINAAAETHGRGLVASDEIELHGFAVDLVEKRDECVESAARSALDQEYSRERRNVAAEEIAQGSILRDRRQYRASHRFSLPTAFQRSFEGPLWRH